MEREKQVSTEMDSEIYKIMTKKGIQVEYKCPLQN
jgi:hypothetical protein